MTIYNYTFDKEYAEELDRDVREAYPHHADEARAFMNQVLRRCDKRKYLVFNGEAYDHELMLGEMSTAHRLVSELVKRRDEGVEIPAWYLENTVRTCLGLGFAVINGDIS